MDVGAKHNTLDPRQRPSGSLLPPTLSLNPEIKEIYCTFAIIAKQSNNRSPMCLTLPPASASRLANLLARLSGTPGPPEIPLLLCSTLNFINFPTNDDCGVRMAYGIRRMAEPCFSNPLPQVP